MWRIPCPGLYALQDIWQPLLLMEQLRPQIKPTHIDGFPADVCWGGPRGTEGSKNQVPPQSQTQRRSPQDIHVEEKQWQNIGFWHGGRHTSLERLLCLVWQIDNETRREDKNTEVIKFLEVKVPISLLPHFAISQIIIIFFLDPVSLFPYQKLIFFNVKYGVFKLFPLLDFSQGKNMNDKQYEHQVLEFNTEYYIAYHITSDTKKKNLSS